MQQKETFDALIKLSDEFNRWFHINVDRQWLQELFWSLSNANIVSICPLQFQYISHSCGLVVTKDNFLDHVNNANCNMLWWSCQKRYWWEGGHLGNALSQECVSYLWLYSWTEYHLCQVHASWKNNALVAWALGKSYRLAHKTEWNL